MFSRSLMVLCVAVMFAGCDNVTEVPAKMKLGAQNTQQAANTETVETKQAKSEQPTLDDWFNAINRTYSTIKETCWDEKAKIWIVRFASDSAEDLNGWFVMYNVQIKQLSNGSLLFTNPQHVEFSDKIQPDLKDIPCKKVEETK